MMSVEPDHYAVLELVPGSALEEVKSQYRRLAKRWHPDLHNNDARSQEQFRRINAAYAFLSDAPRKAAYDAALLAARKREAARKRAASAPRPAPPSRPSPASPTATGSHASVNSTGFHASVNSTGYQTGYHDRVSTDLRMTRSAWLGATAGVVVVLLVIGLSLDGTDWGRPMITANAPSLALERPFLGASGEGAAPVGGPEPAGSLAEAGPPAPFGVPAARPPQAQPVRLSSLLPAPPRSEAPGRVWPIPNDDVTNPAEALKTRLLTRYQAALPRADRLIARGSAVRAARQDTEDETRRILRDQLAVDLADLNETRDRILPAITRLSRQDTPDALAQKAAPVLADLRRLEDARQPVRDDLEALAESRVAVSRVAVSPRVRHRTVWVAPVISAPAPASVSAAPAPSAPSPRLASAPPDAPKPTEKPMVKSASKPKESVSAGQEFILWGK